MSESLCAKCGKAPVVGCEGQGAIPTDDWTMRHCPNYYLRLLGRHLGDEIRCAATIRSPLLEPNPEGGAPLVDMTQNNIRIVCDWNGFLPHLKHVLVFKGPFFPFLIVNDEKIKNVFVGNESYKARAKDDRDEIDTYNSLPDLIGEKYELVVIRLGFLGYKNIAAAGALKEALLHRATLRKATWLLEDTNPDLEWKHSKNEEVEFFVDRQFARVSVQSIAPTLPARPVRSLGMGHDDGDRELPDLLQGLDLGEVAKPVRKEPRRHVEVAQPEETRPSFDDDISLPGSNNVRKGWKR